MSKPSPRKTFARPVADAPESDAELAPEFATALSEVDDDDPSVPAFDINGFDPDEFEWRPVPRRPRADGWSPEVQRSFIEALADTGMVETAADAVNMSTRSAYALRRAPGSESFARAWDVALAHAADRLADVAFQRAIEGVDIPVFGRDGARIGSKRHYNDRLLMFLLRAYRPERYRHAHRDMVGIGETPPPTAAQLAPALAALAPVVPSDPHLRLPPERLENFVDGARGIEDLYERYPDLDREQYEHRRIEPDHPKTVNIRRLRTARGCRKEEADNALLAELDAIHGKGEEDETGALA